MSADVREYEAVLGAAGTERELVYGPPMPGIGSALAFLTGAPFAHRHRMAYPTTVQFPPGAMVPMVEWRWRKRESHGRYKTRKAREHVAFANPLEAWESAATQGLIAPEWLEDPRRWFLAHSPVQTANGRSHDFSGRAPWTGEGGLPSVASAFGGFPYPVTFEFLASLLAAGRTRIERAEALAREFYGRLEAFGAEPFKAIVWNDVSWHQWGGPHDYAVPAIEGISRRLQNLISAGKAETNRGRSRSRVMQVANAKRAVVCPEAFRRTYPVGPYGVVPSTVCGLNDLWEFAVNDGWSSHAFLSDSLRPKEGESPGPAPRNPFAPLVELLEMGFYVAWVSGGAVVLGTTRVGADADK